MAAGPYKLVSLAICPFVQRSAIALEAKGAAYEIEYINLKNKPAWFTELSPLGKLPILQVPDEAGGSEVLYESQVINEYLDEVTEGSMHPSDPLQRAKHRARIELISQCLGAAWRVSQVEREQEAQELAKTLRERLARFEPELGDGPYYTGSDLTLLDAAMAPLMQRLEWLSKVTPLEFFDGLPKVSAWRDALMANPAVVASTLEDIEARVHASFGGYAAKMRDAA